MKTSTKDPTQMDFLPVLFGDDRRRWVRCTGTANLLSGDKIRWRGAKDHKLHYGRVLHVIKSGPEAGRVVIGTFLGTREIQYNNLDIDMHGRTHV